MANKKSFSKKDAESMMSVLAAMVVLGIVDMDSWIETMLDVEEKTPRYKTDRWDGALQLHKFLIDLDNR